MIKSYTDLEQSKKLVEILPLESADMTYCAITEGMREKMIIKDWKVNTGLDIAIKENLFSYRNGYMLPCWSLATLLDVLPNYINYDTICRPHLMRDRDNNYMVIYSASKYSGIYDNPVDACYEMILKLHELNLL